MQISEATIVVSGTSLKAANPTVLTCTIAWGSILIFPLFFMCCDWWVKCVSPAFSIAPSAYISLNRLFQSPNLRAITLTVVDNTFDANKARILYDLISKTKINAFTFLNKAGNYNFYDNEYSNFVKHMKPIKQLPNLLSSIIWGS